MEILEAYDLTRCAHSAAQLVGCDPKTVGRYVTLRDGGADPTVPARRPREVDPYLAKVEELVERSGGKIRADVVHRRLVALGFAGSYRSTCRVVAQAKQAWRAGHGRIFRPWIAEPGMWLQFDWGDGPKIGIGAKGRPTSLFCAWLAWSRYRVVIPTWDQTLGTLVACLDQTLRRLGGAPTYLLTDNAKTVTMDQVAGIPIRHPDPPSRVGRGRPPLRLQGRDLCRLRPAEQGRGGGDRQAGQGRPGAHLGEPAGRLRHLRRAGRSV